MPGPPLNFPNHIKILNVLPGHFASSGGGGLVKGDGDGTVRIDGDPNGVFSVSRIETLELERPPDAPPGSPLSWQIVQVVNGSGPISIGAGNALLITIGFSCPANPSLDSFNATASVVTAAAASPLLVVPITATVSAGSLEIVALSTPPISVGQTQSFSFRLTSTLRHDVGGVFTCDSSPATPFSSDTDPQFPLILAGTSQDLPLAVTCAAGTPPGSYSVTFRFRAIDSTIVFGSTVVDITVIQGRDVSVFPSLSTSVTLPYLSPTLCEIRAVVSGGPGTFNIAPASVPSGVSLENGQQSVFVDGTVFLGITITVDTQAPTETLLAPLILNWSIPADSLHPETAGSLTFGITTTKRNLLFGFESFHVDNCRSKGDHNDSDVLFVTVANPRETLPTQQILLGDNLHAGDLVQEKFVGPFEISDADLLAVTFNVVNGAAGGTSPALALKVAAAVAAALAGLEEAHFLGLAASKIETGLLAAASGIFGALGELLGVASSDPDCSGSVVLRTVPYDKGQFAGGNQQFVPSAPETQPSPHDCGNNPNSTVVYLAKQVS